jgi:hypothetical protein
MARIEMRLLLPISLAIERLGIDYRRAFGPHRGG